jgi:hypothetical protein
MFNNNYDCHSEDEEEDEEPQDGEDRKEGEDDEEVGSLNSEVVSDAHDEPVVHDNSFLNSYRQLHLAVRIPESSSILFVTDKISKVVKKCSFYELMSILGKNFSSVNHFSSEKFDNLLLENSHKAESYILKGLLNENDGLEKEFLKLHLLVLSKEGNMSKEYCIFNNSLFPRLYKTTELPDSDLLPKETFWFVRYSQQNLSTILKSNSKRICYFTECHSILLHLQVVLILTLSISIGILHPLYACSIDI